MHRGGCCNSNNASLSLTSQVPEIDNQCHPFERNSATTVCCVVVGKQLPLFRSLSCMYIHRQTYSHTFCKCYTHTDILGTCPLCVHKNIHEEDLGLKPLLVQVHGSNGGLKQAEIGYWVVNTSLILQMTHADNFAHTSPQNTCWKNINPLLVA